MNQEANMTLYAYNSSLHFDIKLMSLGKRYFLEITTIEDSHIKGTTLVDCADLQGKTLKPESYVTQENPRQSNDALADVLKDLLDFKKQENGVWLPETTKGDTIVLDRPGEDEVKVVTAGDTGYERIRKKSIEVVKEKGCVCPIRDIMFRGCTCGGK